MGAQPQVEGLIYYTFGPARMGYAGLHGNVAYVSGKPVVGARFSLWGDAMKGDKVGVEGLVKQLQTLPKDRSDPKSYSIVVSELGNNYTEIKRAVQQLEQVGGFEIVLPEILLSRLASDTQKKQTCPMPSGPWSTQVGDLPKCAFGQNYTGSCVMTCEGLGLLPVSCDLDQCHDGLSLGRGDGGIHRFKCFDGQVCAS